MKLFVKSIIVGLLLSCAAFAQSGGAYQITQSVTATGAKSSGGSFSIEDTGGQTLAGGLLQNSNYAVYSGFWSPPNLTPTAATVTISGRVTAANGLGIRNAVLTLTDSGGAIRTARTASFGYFYFDDVRIGETYILNVTSKRFVFRNSTRVLNVMEELTDIDFIADN